MVEQRTENSRLGMPLCAVRYKREPLCQLPKPRFEAKVSFGDNWCFLVRRLFVAKNGVPLLAGLLFFARCEPPSPPALPKPVGWSAMGGDCADFHRKPETNSAIVSGRRGSVAGLALLDWLGTPIQPYEPHKLSIYRVNDIR